MASQNFSFVSDAAGGDQFTVVSFSAQEGLSTLYRYEIEVKAPVTAEIDLDDVLDASARFISELDGVEYPVHGVLCSFEETRFLQNYSYFKAILVPHIWKLSNYKTNEIYYQAGDGSGKGGLSIDTIIQQVLEKAGMESTDFDLSGLVGNLLKREYRCQYNESDFDFISRLMENEGVFYYFEQGDAAETIVFINDMNYLELPRPKLFFDVAAQSSKQHDCVYAWSCRKQRLPENVIVRDYNPDEPSLDVSDITAIDPVGQGTEYVYGKNVKSDTEATYLSQIHAETHICRKTQFFGESSVTRLQAGYLFVIEGHPNDKYNGVEYLAVEVSHEGASLDMALSRGKNDAHPQYQNSFVAIPAEVQYRPPRKTRKPKITGTLHAVIDGELASEYAQLDSEGRYKVSMPFDFHNEEHPEGLASARVRMMQPYAGKNRGMQFPMAKGTEVLLSFIDGDPDRPIIAGAINSSAAPGPVTADNQTESVIQTGGNNKIRMEDKFGSERLMLESPAANSWIRVGATNDPIILQGDSPQYVDIGSTYDDPQAISVDSTDPLSPVLSAQFDATEILDLSGNPTTMDTAVAGEYILKYVDSNNTSDTAFRRVIVGHADAFNNDITGSTSDGIRIRSAGNLWLEARTKFGDYHIAPTATEGVALPRSNGNSIGDLYDKFTGSSPSYAPTGMKDMAGTDQTSFKNNVLPLAHLKVSSLDTITTQEGNIYDFGGYWNYNLGNSFAEEHINQSAALNNKHDIGWPVATDTAEFSGSDRDLRDTATGGIETGLAVTGYLAAGTSGMAPLAAVIAGGLVGSSVAHSGSASGTTLQSFVGVSLGVIGAAGLYVGAGAAVGAIFSAFSLLGEGGEKFQGNVGDVMGGPGPNTTNGTIKTWANVVGSSFDNANSATGAPTSDDRNQNSDPSTKIGPMHTDTTWATKQFGDAYNFNRGNDISIRVGNTEEHHRGDSYEFRYGGTHEEVKYNGAGQKVHWEKVGGGVAQEGRWHPLSGLLTSYEYKKDGWFTYEGSFVIVPTVKISTSMSTVQGEIALSAGALKMGITAHTGIEMDLKLCAGLFVNMELKRGGEVTLNEVSGEMEFKSFGIQAQRKAALQASNQTLLLEQVALNLKNGGLTVQDGALDLETKKLKVKSGALDISV